MNNIGRKCISPLGYFDILTIFKLQFVSFDIIIVGLLDYVFLLMAKAWTSSMCKYNIISIQ